MHRRTNMSASAKVFQRYAEEVWNAQLQTNLNTNRSQMLMCVLMKRENWKQLEEKCLLMV